MQTRVQTIGTCKEDPRTGRANLRFTIREKDGRLKTRRLRQLAKEQVITYVPTELLDDLVIAYNAEITKLGLSQGYHLFFKTWPEDGLKKEQLIVDLIDRRRDLIRSRHIIESEDGNKRKGTELFKLFDEKLSMFDKLSEDYDLSNSGDVSLNPIEGLTDMYSKLLADASAEAAAKELGSEVGGWL